ncbi:hypothetical protein PIB30_003763 [Stylosanthes scabra]|uniref:Transposase (putative) gypsy type domain-containing protein n=1 Tax=Stylosanthes scabra TaxID=79078 RepID=A0ABU6R2E8_9FABA|nr:hypothetical protein [Stylosanthes scabra]
MFIEFGVRVPFSDFQQRLLNRACVAPSQLHPNAWALIRCFELVTSFLELPQEPEVFIFLFKFYSSNTAKKTKKGYMSVRPAKGKKIFGLYEDSFHGFKGLYFKIVPVGNHRPFWLSLEGDGVGFDVAPVTYEGLRAEQRDTVDVLTALFAERNLRPKPLLSHPEEAWKKIDGRKQRDLESPSSSDSSFCLHKHSCAGYSGGRTCQFWSVGSSNVGNRDVGSAHEVSSPGRDEQQLSLPSPNKRVMLADASVAKRQQTEGQVREFSAVDRSFDASGFIATHLLGPKAQETLRDYDLVESFRWAQWALLKLATIMKSVEPRLTMMDEAERTNTRLARDMKALNLQKTTLEVQLADAIKVREKAEGDLKAFEKSLEVFKAKKDEEELESEVVKLKDSVASEKVRADRAVEKIPGLEKQRDDNAEDAKAAVAVTEGVLKAQLAVLLPEFDTSQIDFFNEIVDGKVVDLQPSDGSSSFIAFLFLFFKLCGLFCEQL